MISLLLFIVIFVLVIVLLVISTVFGFIRSIFSFGKRNNQTQNSQPQDFEQPVNKSKVFDKTEGEYVDYEEVK
jgi:flagellar basal body-associated protein FliL